MIISTTGIVLNKFRYKDTSLIVRVVTRDTGLCSFIVRVGKGKKKKNIFNYFQPLSIIEIEYDSNNKRDLHFFKEVDLKFNFKFDFKKFILEELQITLNEKSKFLLINSFNTFADLFV